MPPSASCLAQPYSYLRGSHSQQNRGIPVCSCALLRHQMMSEVSSGSPVGCRVTMSRTISGIEASACMVALKKHVFPRFRKDRGKVTPPCLDCHVRTVLPSSTSFLHCVVDDPAVPDSLLRGLSAEPSVGNSFCCCVVAFLPAAATTFPYASVVPPSMPTAALLSQPLPAPSSESPDPSMPSAFWQGSVLTFSWSALPVRSSTVLVGFPRGNGILRWRVGRCKSSPKV